MGYFEPCVYPLSVLVFMYCRYDNAADRCDELSGSMYSYYSISQFHPVLMDPASLIEELKAHRHPVEIQQVAFYCTMKLHLTYCMCFFLIFILVC